MLRDVQRVLIAALLTDDPVSAIRAAAGADPHLSEQERRWLRTLSPDGVAMTALIVKKLRFERLTEGDRSLAKLFDREPQAFLDRYRAYTAATPPTPYFPDAEARAFRQWKEKEQENAE